jgi:hypothetical protein
LQDEFVVVIRKNHPATIAETSSIETFAALPYLEIPTSQYATDFIDQALARRSLGG